MLAEYCLSLNHDYTAAPEGLWQEVRSFPVPEAAGTPVLEAI